MVYTSPSVPSVALVFLLQWCFAILLQLWAVLFAIAAVLASIVTVNTEPFRLLIGSDDVVIGLCVVAAGHLSCCRV